jgi:WD40 repeat protein
MPISSQTFRIFVSSTFNDFKAERDALQSTVFPRLRKLCTAYGCRFQAIDLRWGVSEEAGLDQATMRICLNEIERSQSISPRPNFILLLGDRYGWRPLPSQIEADEFEAILEKIPDEDQALIHWDDTLPEKGKGWYRKDENAIPPEYRLRARRLEFPEDTSQEQRQEAADVEAQEWNEIEQQIRSAFLLAIEQLGWDSQDPRREKYEASATEQEILQGALNLPLQVPEAREHVFCFIRSIEGISDPETAKDFFDLVDGTERDVESNSSLDRLKQRLLQLFPDLSDTEFHDKLRSIDLSKREVEPGSAMRQWLQDQLSNHPHESTWIPKLRQFLAKCPPEEVDLDLALEFQRLLPNLFQYNTKITDNAPEQDYLDQLCDDVYVSLAGVIHREIAKLAGDELEIEIENHLRFGQDRAGVDGNRFIGREDVLNHIHNYIANPRGLPFAIFGASGSGKSAVMARAAQLAMHHPSAELIVRFLGSTPESSNGFSFLRSVCRQIARGYENDKEAITPNDRFNQTDAPKSEDALPSDFRELAEEFSRQLSRATAEKPLIIFLDALDQLSEDEGAHNLFWLPRELPDHVRLIISTAMDPPECLKSLEEKLPDSNLIQLEPMNQEDGEAILNLWLKAASRHLQPDQFKHVMDRFMGIDGDELAGGLPLYLKLAFEEARHWRSYSDPAETILEPTITSVIRHNLFKRLSQEGNHGQRMVSRSLGYLAASKNGLTEDEMLDVLSLDEEVMANFRQRSPKSPKVHRLPVIVWSRLHADLEAYLSERGGDGTSLMTFYHRQLGEVVRQDYLNGDEGHFRHEHLANYFLKQDFEVTHPHGTTPNLRKLSELPYQLTHAANNEGLLSTLTEYDFLRSKIMALGTQPLIADFKEAECKDILLPDLQSLKEALQLSAHVLDDDPAQIGCQLTGRLLQSDLPSIRTLLENLRTQDSVWLRPLRASLLQPGGPLLRTLVGHRTPVSEVATSEDGEFIFSRSQDGVMRIWDSDSGNTVQLITDKEYAEQAWQRSTESGILVEDPSQQRTLNINYDSIEVRDVSNNALLSTLLGHNRKITSHAFSPDGQILVTGGKDYTVRVWDLGVHTTYTVLPHPGGVTAAAAAKEGKWVLSGGIDGTLRLWDLLTGREVRELSGHTGRVNAISIFANGQRAVTASSDTTMKMWDLDRGVEMTTLSGHEASVLSLALTPDGQHALSASEDRTLKAWDLSKGVELCSVRGPRSLKPAIAISPDGQFAVAGYRENVLRVWDLSTSKRIATCMGHQNTINVVAFSPDGRFIVSGSNDQTLRVWEASNGRQRSLLAGHWDYVRGLDIARNHQVVSIAEDDTVRIWDINTGEQIHQLGGREVDPSRLSLPPSALRTGFYPNAPTRVLTIPDGRGIVSFYVNDDTLRLWDIERGELITAFTGDQVLACCAMTENGSIIAGTLNGQVHLLQFEGNLQC